MASRRVPKLEEPMPLEELLEKRHEESRVPVMRHCPQCGILIEAGLGEYGLAHHEHRSIPKLDESMTTDKAEKVLVTLLLHRVAETKSVESVAAGLSALARLRMAKRPTRPPGRPPSSRRRGGDDDDEMEAFASIVTQKVR